MTILYSKIKKKYKFICVYKKKVVNLQRFFMRICVNGSEK